MQLEQLLEKLPENYSAIDIEHIEKAYHFAEKAHQGQTLASGLPYITHCASVAAILAELTVPPELVVAGLLHDVVEDTSITLDDIRKEFNPEIANLVDGATKLTKLPNLLRGDHHLEAEALKPEASPHKKNRDDDLAEVLRKTFLAMSDDIRVVLIKLADRLHNMRTLSYSSEENQKRIAQETLRCLCPAGQSPRYLAGQMGVGRFSLSLCSPQGI